jgi:hypothetical protein
VGGLTQQHSAATKQGLLFLKKKKQKDFYSSASGKIPAMASQ